MKRRLPAHGWIGIAALGASELLMLRRVEPFWTWHTPIAWSAFILIADAIVWRRRGDSWLTRSPGEFVFLAVCSIPLWLVFEYYNLFIRNWYYVNLPENFWLRQAGYAWSFATIWPAIFMTAELVGALREARQSHPRPENGSAAWDRRSFVIDEKAAWVFAAVGAAMLVWPIVWPSPYLAAPVWLGFILLLDPVNRRLGGESLLQDAREGRWDRLINLGLSGLICGFLWEFWNYWARAKWIYAVPILPDVKIFEMPVAGYLGFPAFALECFTMYVTVRLVLWRGRARPISL
jgi:hypothetical protein